jgi:predicted small metal-binding protein
MGVYNHQVNPHGGTKINISMIKKIKKNQNKTKYHM